MKKVQEIPFINLCELQKNLSSTHEFMIARLEVFLDENQNIEFPHRHNFYQMVLLTQGSGKHSIDFESYLVTRGQFYCMQANMVHTWDFEKDVKGYLINFSSDFLASGIGNHLISGLPILEEPGFTPVFQLPETLFNKLQLLFEEALEMAKLNDAFTHLYIQSYIIQILVEINRFAILALGHNIQNKDHYLVKSFKKLIELHFREKKLPTEYADLLHVSANHLNAKCKANQGIPAGELIRKRILLESKRLLINSNLSIGEIAYQLGFNDQSYFVKFFKKSTQITPDGFRKSKIKHLT